MLRKSGINDPVFHSLFQILTPFGIYIFTEDILHASGVIAVVAAGIIHSIVREHTETLRFKVLDAKRSEIRRMYEAGEINAGQEKELRKFTNYIESIILYEHNE